MTNSSFVYHVFKLEKNRALGHASARDHVLIRIPEIPSAGLYSNISDMTKYTQFHLNGGIVDGKRILSKDLMEQFQNIQFDLKDQRTGYTLGFYREVVSKIPSAFITPAVVVDSEAL